MSHIFDDSLLKNSIYLMITSLIGNILAFFFWVIAAKYYTPNDIGVTSAIFSSIWLISIIGSIGLPTALMFYLPRDINTDKIISSCLVIGIISSIIFSLIFILGLKIWGPGLILTLSNLENILIFIVITAAMSISGLIGAMLTAGRRSSFQMVKETVYHFIKIFPLILLVNLGAIGILLSICIGFILSIVIGFILLYKTWKYLPIFTLDPIIMKMASFSARNYVADILYWLPRLILPIMILNMISAKSAGYFYIAMMMAGLLYGISQSISSSLLVESSHKDNFWDNANKAIKFNFIILIFGLLFFMIFGRFILNMFNPSYAENANVTMIILVITSIPISLINIFNAVRNSQNRVMITIIINIIVAGVTLLLSILLIRLMNIEGAAISYLIANTAGAIVSIYSIKNPKENTLRLLNEIKNSVLYHIFINHS